MVDLLESHMYIEMLGEGGVGDLAMVQEVVDRSKAHWVSEVPIRVML